MESGVLVAMVVYIIMPRRRAAMATALSESDLKDIEEQAPRGEIPLRLEQDRAGRAWIEPDEGARKALRAVPRLVDEVRRLRTRLQAMQEEQERRTQDARRKTKDEPAGRAQKAPPQSEDLGSLLAAPFRVSSKAASAAKDDPLAALAVQVARSMAEDASDVERARLIAMAFAAAEGNLDAFWQARKQRSLAKLGAVGREQ
jgi:hypothetical protein